MARIIIGTSGFFYNDWKGVFYPKEMDAKDYLEYYSQQFQAIELNFSYYRIPNARQTQQMMAKSKGMVEFVIAGMNDQPGRCGDPQPDPIRDGMANMEQLNPERADLDLPAGFNGVEFSVLQPFAAREFYLEQAPGKRGCIDRGVHHIKDMVNGAGMVFVSVGDNDAADVLMLILEISVEIRDDVINPEHIIFRKHDARVDNQNFMIILDDHHIFSDFSQAPEGDDA